MLVDIYSRDAIIQSSSLLISCTCAQFDSLFFLMRFSLFTTVVVLVLAIGSLLILRNTFSTSVESDFAPLASAPISAAEKAIPAAEKAVRSAPSVLPPSLDSPVKVKGCIVYLVRTHPDDLKELSFSLYTLAQHKAKLRTYPIIVLHEGFSECTQQMVRAVRPELDVRFVKITLSSPPGNFELLSFPTRSKNGDSYQRMCRFFFRQIFFLPELQEFTHYLRVDSDSKFLSDSLEDASLNDPFRYAVDHKLEYATWRENVDCGMYIEGILELADAFAKEHLNGVWANPKEHDLFTAMNRDAVAAAYAPVARELEETKHQQFRPTCLPAKNDCHCLPGFYNNFEVADMRVFRSAERTALYDAVDAHGGIPMHRWGDAVLRRVTLALFSRPEAWKVLPFKSYQHRKHMASGDPAEYQNAKVC